jgi:inosine/xanthosine triphosphate pyrophosphatase family protein
VPLCRKAAFGSVCGFYSARCSQQAKQQKRENQHFAKKLQNTVNPTFQHQKAAVASAVASSPFCL